MRKTTLGSLAAGALVVLAWLPAPASARGSYVDRIPNGGVNECDNCHGAGGDFAADFFAANTTWTPALAALDSDGDGFSNGWELQDPQGAWTSSQPDPGDVAFVTDPSDTASVPAPPVAFDPQQISHQESPGQNESEPGAVSNVGGVPFDYQLTTQAPWLTLDPSLGMDLPPGEQDAIALRFTTDGLMGVFEESVGIAIDGIAPEQLPALPVTLTVPEPGGWLAAAAGIAGAATLASRRRGSG